MKLTMAAIAAALITALNLTACSSDAEKAAEQLKSDTAREQEYNNSMKEIDGLKDCTAHHVRGENVRTLIVVRCPLSVTDVQYQQGKFTSRTTTINP